MRGVGAPSRPPRALRLIWLAILGVAALMLLDSFTSGSSEEGRYGRVVPFVLAGLALLQYRRFSDRWSRGDIQERFAPGSAPVAEIGDLGAVEVDCDFSILRPVKRSFHSAFGARGHIQRDRLVLTAVERAYVIPRKDVQLAWRGRGPTRRLQAEGAEVAAALVVVNFDTELIGPLRAAGWPVPSD
jgi:hypothetical protein